MAEWVNDLKNQLDEKVKKEMSERERLEKTEALLEDAFPKLCRQLAEDVLKLEKTFNNEYHIKFSSALNYSIREKYRVVFVIFKEQNAFTIRYEQATLQIVCEYTFAHGKGAKGKSNTLFIYSKDGEILQLNSNPADIETLSRFLLTYLIQQAKDLS